ncbi:MAG: TIGR04255 family protein [Methylococcales bacterium]
MGLSFKNPPLVELIAELRWALPIPTQVTGVGVGAIPITTLSVTTLSANQYEEFFMRFGSKVAAAGFSRFERIVPPGFPFMPYQPVYRYRYVSEDQGVKLYQLGPDIFSANITPPYQSWEHFKPVVAQGVEMLLESRSDEQKIQPFSAASLRYIDAFKDDLTQGRSIRDFMADVLDIKISLPEAVTRHALELSRIEPLLQLAVPVSSAILNLTVANGAFNNERAVIMDTTVSTTQELKPTKEDIMSVFDNAHHLIHELFVGLTKPLEELMKPEDH